MRPLWPNLLDCKELGSLLMFAELLVRRGRPSPLQRIWVPTGKRRVPVKKPPASPPVRTE